MKIKFFEEKKLIVALFSFVLIYGYLIYKIHLSKEFNQWDFRTYYYAVKVYEKGENPYYLENLKKESGEKVEFKFIYPIYTLLFFKLFTLFEYDTAFDIYIFIKFILIIFLFFLWCVYFFKRQNIFFLLFVSILAFENTIFADLATGNVSIFEQFFLWIGFYFFMEKKYMPFTIFIVMASLFKIVFLFFLLILFFTDNKNKIIYFIIGIFLMFFILVFSFLKEPKFFNDYLKNLILLDERGYINPAILPMLKDIFEILGKKIKSNFIIYFSYVAYFFYVFILSIFAFKFIQKIKNIKISEWDKNRIILFFMICFYTVISPRFKEYSYIVMLLPTTFIILKIKTDIIKYLLFFIFALSKDMFAPDINKIYQKFIWPYYQFWLTLICFVLYILYIKFNLKEKSQ